MPQAARADTCVVATHSHARRGDRAIRRTRLPWVDHDLVTAAQRGDPEAMGRLFAAAAPRLVAFFRYSGLTKVESEDLAADVMEKVLRSLTRLRDSKAFEAWLWTIARNQLRGHLRKNRGEPAHAASPPGMEPSELVELAEEHGAIRAALGRLPMRDRQLLWLREVEGMSHAEIGGRLGAATGAVRVALHRARRRLEAAYREVGHEGSGQGQEQG
jgi:RNA polymerase sigma-70 factor (ECF subfamily)